MSLTLYTTTARHGEAVKIAAQIAGVEVKVENVKTVHDKSVANQSPVLATASGNVFGASAVLRYIARGSAASGLYGNSYNDTTAVDQWVDFISSTLAPNATAWLTPIQKKKAVEPAVIKAFKASTVSALRAINTHLISNTFLAGHTVTIADVLLFATAADLVTTVLAPGVRRPLPAFVRWFNTLANDPVFAGIVGEVAFTAKEQQAPKPAKKEVKKEEKKVEAPKKKPVNPLLLLPESKMTMDATKKDFFSTAPYNATFFDDFWTEKYDPEGYCVYTCNYNYNSENEIYWQTQNLLGGYVQRLDGARKFAFGVMLLSGSDEETQPWTLEGGFIFRGPGIPFEVSDGNPQSEYYTWTKVDTNTAEGRKKFEDLMKGDTVEGRNVLDRRYFK